MPRVMEMVLMDASEPLDASEARSEINTYMLHNESAVLSNAVAGQQISRRQIKAPQRYPFK
jgi:hypothetical protein